MRVREARYYRRHQRSTLEKVVKEILKALTTASQCRGLAHSMPREARCFCGNVWSYEVDCGGPSDVTLSPRTNMTTKLKVGDPAPDFKATAVGGIYGGGHEVKFADLAGSTLVLYFYPENDTPGCTIQACDLRDSWRELQSKVELFGVSVDSVESHQEFIKKHGLPFPLLSDSDREIMKAYQVWSEENMVTERTTYLIGPDRKIKAILKNVKPSEHVTQLLKALAS